MLHDEFNKIDEEYFDTILDDELKFEGTIKNTDSIIIKGNVKGKIESNKVLVVGPNATIDADIIGNKIHCYGKINGNINASEELVLHSPAFVNGDIITVSMSFEKNCILNGNITMSEKSLIDDNVSIDSEKEVKK